MVLMLDRIGAISFNESAGNKGSASPQMKVHDDGKSEGPARRSGSKRKKRAVFFRYDKEDRLFLQSETIVSLSITYGLTTSLRNTAEDAQIGRLILGCRSSCITLLGIF